MYRTLILPGKCQPKSPSDCNCRSRKVRVIDLLPSSLSVAQMQNLTLARSLARSQLEQPAGKLCKMFITKGLTIVNGNKKMGL